jgi:hypothetical protein
VDYTANKPLSAVTSGDVFNFIKSRLDATDKPWSHSYATGRAKRALFEAFALAKTLGHVDKNPVGDMDIVPKIDAKTEERPPNTHH